MPSNIIQVNGSKDLEWYIGDSKMPKVVEVLNNIGFKQGGKKMSIKMKVIHPRKDETYRVGSDDNCLVVSSGKKETAPKVWISKSMQKWIGDNYKE